ncbi:MAG: PIN domain-containing protein [Acidobacteria bacterium]|nr:MAG: PIN domain-containing protein [Acidobacteriota bacterium]
MILLDTNVLVFAADARSPYRAWAHEIIADAVSSDAAAINAVSLAEICVGDAEPDTVADRIRMWGIVILDVPAAAAEACAVAYLAYSSARKTQSGKDSPRVPLPDFFIGAHAQVMGWPLATVDEGRFRTYFPAVPLKTPRDPG